MSETPLHDSGCYFCQPAMPHMVDCHAGGLSSHLVAAESCHLGCRRFLHWDRRRMPAPAWRRRKAVAGL